VVKEAGNLTAQNTSKPAWQFQHSVACKATRQFAWSYWTNIEHWNDPPASFQIDGPFQRGSRLTTSLPGQTLQSLIRALKPDREAIIEMELPDAILSFHWTFEDLPEDRTRITQRLILSGRNAGSFVDQARMLEEGTPAGMNKLAGSIERAHRLVIEQR
jgi:hypothetical protein